MKKNGKYVSILVLTFLLLAGALVVLGPEEKIEAEATALWTKTDPDLGDNVALKATGRGSAAMTDAPHGWNDEILTGQNGWISCSGTGNDGSYMEYVWDTPVSIWAFRIYHFYTDGSRRILIGCQDMQYWDGSTYQSLGPYDAEAENLYTSGKPYARMLPQAVSTTRFRLYNLLGLPGTLQTSNPSISEWEVYEGGAETSLDVELAPGYGEGSNIYPAQGGGGMYWADANVFIESTVENLTYVTMSIGADLDDPIILSYDFNNKAFLKSGDKAGVVILDEARSNVKYSSSDPTHNVAVRFYFDFSLDWDHLEFIDVNFEVTGEKTCPSHVELEDAIWVESRLEKMGSMVAYTKTRGFIQNGGWVHGNEKFLFRGIRAVYVDTAVSPRAGAITFTITDEEGNQFVQEDVEEECMVEVLAENDYVRKEYTLTISEGTDVSDDITYVLNVDPYKPLPPQGIQIHADSFVDKNTAFDDDNEVFVTWDPAEDFESGIGGYYVTTHDPLDPEAEGEAIWVESPDTSTKVYFDGTGSRKVWVWSVDKAGNPSIPSFGVTKIDTSEIMFSEFSPGDQVWVNTHTPVCSVLVDDGGGSGVSAKDLQYSVSTTTTDYYNAWQPAKVPRDADQLRPSIPTVFENGKNNWIRFRGKDVAGNGWTSSEDFNVWVDEEPISFTSFRPFESEYQNGEAVVVSLDITDIHGGRQGSGVATETLEYRYTTGGKGLYGDWSPVEITSESESSVHVELEMVFSEGTRNYIQFRGHDNVGNYATSKEYNVKVNSAPVLDAYIGEPSNGRDYVSTEKILFDASGTEDPDGDSLGFTWYSDLDRLLSSEAFFFKSLSPGVHVITLIVNDPAHSLVETFEITVLEEEQIDPMSIDSDGDGLYDEWEIKYRLNPFRPDSHLDSDNDMFTNLQEFQNGTDPTKATSHPPYPVPTKEEASESDVDAEYRSLTFIVVLLSLIVIVALLLLTLAKRRNFKDEVQEEKELESEEQDYRRSLDKRRSERLDMK
ncbi:MAG: hypothetical protein R6V01_08750 [Thermoplasmatota archaeon]